MIYDLSSGQKVYEKNSNLEICTASFLHGNLCCALINGSLLLYDFLKDDLRETLIEGLDSRRVSCIAPLLFPDIILSNLGTIYIVDLSTGKIKFEGSLSHKLITDIKLIGTDTLIFSSLDCHLYIYNLNGMKRVESLKLASGITNFTINLNFSTTIFCALLNGQVLPVIKREVADKPKKCLRKIYNLLNSCELVDSFIKSLESKDMKLIVFVLEAIVRRKRMKSTFSLLSPKFTSLFGLFFFNNIPLFSQKIEIRDLAVLFDFFNCSLDQITKVEHFINTSDNYLALSAQIKSLFIDIFE